MEREPKAPRLLRTIVFVFVNSINSLRALPAWICAFLQWGIIHLQISSDPGWLTWQSNKTLSHHFVFYVILTGGISAAVSEK